METYTFIITRKNIERSTITVRYIPQDTNLHEHIIKIRMEDDTLEGTESEVKQKIRKEIVRHAPHSLWERERELLEKPVVFSMDDMIGVDAFDPVTAEETNQVMEEDANTNTSDSGEFTV